MLTAALAVGSGPGKADGEEYDARNVVEHQVVEHQTLADR